MADPSVSVVVVAHDAAPHLPACLDSVAALDYPAERLETIVVDNASSDETRELVRTRYPWARVLAQERNLGFAEANNVAARASSADCLALLNADMRVEPSWLRELVALYDPAERVCAVASLILDWEGRRVDFAGGTLNFSGHGNQLGHGLPVEQVAPHDGSELLFPCGGAMLVDRAVFLDAGGFDPSYFIYFEDVDLGWRLRLLGYRTRLAARARAYHRGHATTSAFRAAQVRLLYDRNALRTLIKNLDEPNMQRLLAASLLLLAERARLDSGSDRAAFDVAAGDTSPAEQVQRLGLAPLHAVGDVLADLDGLLEQRRAVQSRRRIGDDEVFALFGRPFQPAGRDDDPYLRSTSAVARALALDELFVKRRATRVLVASNGEDRDITTLVARLAPTVLALRHAPEPREDDVETATYRSTAELVQLARETDLVILDSHALRHAHALAATGVLVALDLADTRSKALARAVRLDPGLLARIDAFLWASEQERDDMRRLLARAAGGDEDEVAGRLVARALDVADGPSPTLRTLVEEPWRWRAARAARRAREVGPVTEDAQLVLARLRRAAAARAAAAPPALPVRAARRAARLARRAARVSLRRRGSSPDRAP